MPNKLQSLKKTGIFAPEMQDDLTARDKWGVFERYSLEPVYTVRSALSDEMKFCLLRD